eukprot:3394619-Ditylum_brightwellii.AAC.1
MAPDKETMEREPNPYNMSQNQTCLSCRTMRLSRSDGICCTWCCSSIEKTNIHSGVQCLHCRPSYKTSKTFQGGIPGP